ncbi:MBL fold metallo-hydrolase [Arthrobacter cavernae]|uniref:MBL fold metallo-hydrolase n=1 Tax=Arthrobacter cavernae TaxID=2817681 RepID=A0A939HDD0_9MICC|nr:MBL fold metallo-hydrolase [Arthrobacter cavernae]MBO1268794.1 MBL fold metallo-hydrolase [Arthrobacter cavernae]
MLIKQYYIDCLSHGSYLIGDETTGRAVVVDPRRDIGGYLADAASSGLSIEGVINTHFHADFIAGHLELAEATGAWIGYGRRAEAEYDVRALSHGERISLGSVELEILETPGHTWESISVLVRERPGGAVPHAVLTGDALFVGDVGRPDLAAAVGADSVELARALYRSIHEILMVLPGEVRLMPAHGAGSACGKNLSEDLESTIGAQRFMNPSVQPMSEEDFVQMITTGQPSIPRYFATDAVLNRKNRALMDSPSPAVLGAAAVRELVAAGAKILDTRSPEAFASGHLEQSLNVGIDGRFAETAGMVLDVDEEIIIVAEPGREREAALRLGRIGYDRVAGYLNVSHDAFAVLAPTQTGRRIKAEDLEATAGDENAIILDVRNQGERDDGSVPGSIHIPLAEIGRRHAELPDDRPVIVHCAGGWRSSVAASVLRERGHARVSDMLGGYTAWAALNTPATVGNAEGEKEKR